MLYLNPLHSRLDLAVLESVFDVRCIKFFDIIISKNFNPVASGFFITLPQTQSQLCRCKAAVKYNGGESIISFTI